MIVPRRHPARHRHSVPRPAATPHPSSPTAPSPGHTLAGSPPGNLRTHAARAVAVRFTITPLGSAGGRTVGQVVDDIVRYLDGPQAPAVTSPSLTPATDDGPSRYYADGSADPGRWLGNGAAEMGLTGAVASRDFARVLAGRDPDSGVRLITARGSAGRRATLARGTQTRWDVDGEPLYDTRDAATALRLEVAEVERLVAAGEALAVRHLVALLGGAAPGIVEFEGSYLAPVIDRDGTRWITEQELQRCEAGRAAGPDPDAVAERRSQPTFSRSAKPPAVAGLSYPLPADPVYQSWNATGADRGRPNGWEGHPQRPFLAAHRGTKGQWLVKRADLVDFLRHRKAPAVRVGYDLTLTTEKSLGVLALLGDEKTRAAVLGAIEAGNDRGLAHLEYAAAMARAKGEPVEHPRLDRGFVSSSHQPRPRPVPPPSQRRRQHRRRSRRHPSRP